MQPTGGWKRPDQTNGAYGQALMASLNGLFNAVRKMKRSWSTQKDKDFHDQLFAVAPPQPFTFSYFGCITIMRFADLAAAHVEKATFVLDLGCGPAEITCELARRFPHIFFLGVDHSANAIARAEDNARVLELRNIKFQAAAIEDFTPNQTVDLVLMFDSFHHLADPRRLIERMGRSISQFLLIEPRGDWRGRHVRDLDFDWIVSDMEKIRRHLAMKIGEPAAMAVMAGRGEKKLDAAALENRYNLEKFKKYFQGFGLRIRGTISGLEAYPPDPFLSSPSRELFGKKAYEIFAELDEMLEKNGQDILAKHWVIFASKDLKSNDIRIPHPPSSDDKTESLQGPYDVEFENYDGPCTTQSAAQFRVQIQFHNHSYRPLSSLAGENPDYLSYHWLDHRGMMVPGDGLRTPLPKNILPDTKGKTEMNILAPEKPGRYILAIDFVQEGKTWFSEAGNPCLRVRMVVKKK
ncbi:MAG: class I SAM-dependent methyltransferase [Candidatus Aminicenantes bacterium]|nr:class I SAM-dependent methyltransferase [Candidatus Aminicenantes bacterium]